MMHSNESTTSNVLSTIRLILVLLLMGAGAWGGSEYTAQKYEKGAIAHVCGRYDADLQFVWSYPVPPLNNSDLKDPGNSKKGR